MYIYIYMYVYIYIVYIIYVFIDRIDMLTKKMPIVDMNLNLTQYHLLHCLSLLPKSLWLR